MSSFGCQCNLVLLAQDFEFILQLEPRGSLPPLGFTLFALCLGSSPPLFASRLRGGLLTGVLGGTNRCDLGHACSRGRSWFVRAVHLDSPRLASGVRPVTAPAAFPSKFPNNSSSLPTSSTKTSMVLLFKTSSTPLMDNIPHPWMVLLLPWSLIFLARKIPETCFLAFFTCLVLRSAPLAL